MRKSSVDAACHLLSIQGAMNSTHPPLRPANQGTLRTGRQRRWRNDRQNGFAAPPFFLKATSHRTDI